MPSFYNSFNEHPNYLIFLKNSKGKINVFDETGKKVGVNMVQNYNYKINLGWLPTGRYFIKPEDEDYNSSKVINIK